MVVELRRDPQQRQRMRVQPAQALDAQERAVLAGSHQQPVHGDGVLDGHRRVAQLMRASGIRACKKVQRPAGGRNLRGPRVSRDGDRYRGREPLPGDRGRDRHRLGGRVLHRVQQRPEESHERGWWRGRLELTGCRAGGRRNRVPCLDRNQRLRGARTRPRKRVLASVRSGRFILRDFYFQADSLSAS